MEPPQPAIIAVEEPSQPPQETAESEEESSFAKLLAGMLQKTEIDGEAEDAQLAEFSGGEVEVDILEEMSDAGKKLDLFGAAQEAVSVPQEELSETDIPEEQLSFLLSADHLLTRSVEPVGDGADSSGDFSLELFDVQTGRLTEVEPDALPSMLSAKTEGADSLEQIAAAELAAADGEESLSAEKNGKKDRAQLKAEDVEEPSPRDSRKEETASLRTAPEKESRGKLDEARNRPRRDRVTFEVNDLRTGAGNDGLKNAQMRFNAGADVSSGRAEAPVREMTLELRLPEGQNAPQTRWEVKAGNALENMLARELHQNFNGDIVRHASMALRDGGEGTIRIALKPESLGNVKIHLEMAENKITGHIVVESEEALNAFKREIASLEQAFKDSGFTNANLNLSLTADGRNMERQEQEANSWDPRMAASRYDDSSRDGAQLDSVSLVDVFFGRRQGAVNMLA
jgi:flagellar hook-length control protein FliK